MVAETAQDTHATVHCYKLVLDSFAYQTFVDVHMYIVYLAEALSELIDY